MSKYLSVPFINPRIQMLDKVRALNSINSGWLVAGKYTKSFEKSFQSYLCSGPATFTSSCTSALEIALLLANLKPGDEVITTPLSYVATSNVIISHGLSLKFVDVDIKTGLLTPEMVERNITEKTRAVIVVHLHGQMSDMRGFKLLANKYNLRIIEDAAHCIEGSRDGIRPGQYGDFTAFSFHAAKNITSGQGGALVSGELDEARAKKLRRDGVYNNEYDIRVMDDFGGKFDATDFQAALLIGQLRRIDKQHRNRVLMRQKYSDFCASNEIYSVETLEGVVHAAHMFVINILPKRRNEIRSELLKRGIRTSVHYNPIHLEPYYQERFGFKHGDFPNAEFLGFSSITLPLFSSLTTKEVNHVKQALLEVITETDKINPMKLI
jgi:dTDP-4-amino-4,6-dideoxygalactose transaminase